MTVRKAAVTAAGAVLAAVALPSWVLAVYAQAGEQFSEEQIKRGSALYAQNCSPCHGPRMLDAQAAFDLRKFPPGEKNRFMQSVAKGKNAMPPWGDLFKSDEFEALWAYVIAGEKQQQ